MAVGGQRDVALKEEEYIVSESSGESAYSYFQQGWHSYGKPGIDETFKMCFLGLEMSILAITVNTVYKCF